MANVFVKTVFITALLVAASLLSTGAAQERASVSLAGEWKLRLDPQDEGIRDGWAARPMESRDVIQLPNTTDLAGFGFPLDTNTMQYPVPFPVTTRFPGVAEPVRADEHGYLVRRHLFVGPAWYEREIDIPAAWKNRSVTFRIERAMWRTEVWLDGKPMGSCDSLVAEHRYALGVVAPGKHRLSVRVDNRLVHNLSTITHAYGPETQSRWNGMVGGISLEAAHSVSVKSASAYPAADRRSLRLVVKLANGANGNAECKLRARLLPEKGSEMLAESVIDVVWPSGEAAHEIVLKLKEAAEPWDEFNPARYRVQVTIQHDGALLDAATVMFGFRTIERAGKDLRLNGRRLFLRGTLDCCVYPKTGHPPMTVPEWERVLRVIKEHGFNHVRYHTWCPPEAAFEAADRLGVYLQPEAPAWVDDWVVGTATHPKGIGRDPEAWGYIKNEVRRISEAYGNHPSFVMFTIGNEFGESSTDWPVVNAMVEEIKSSDPRRVYSGCTARRHLNSDDFWVTHDSGAPTRGVGSANTDWDFSAAANASPVPVIAHETGQRPGFPDYPRLLPKFSGPLLPLNLERYRHALEASGMEEQLAEFVTASARFQFTQYKAEHEGMLRTPGYAGYQLLMLNDFTGQSEALVGVLDPFWESKGVVSASDVRTWNSPTVVLARFPKFVWTSDETFQAKVEVAHFGQKDVSGGALEWSLATKAGKVIAQGRQGGKDVPSGSLSSLGDISAPLSGIDRATEATLSARFGGSENRWTVWVYPAASAEPEPSGVLTTRALDDKALTVLRSGGKVLLLAHGMRNLRAVKTGFTSVYWSAGWWGNQFSSLGITCDPGHPVFADFPNDGWSDWQWQELCAGATTFLLDGAPGGFRPLVQPVPDFHYNSLLGHVFEAKVQGGSLLVCGYDLESDLGQRVAAKQFRRSLFRYAQSAAFQPTQELAIDWVQRMLGLSGLARRGAQVLRVDSEDAANGNVAAKAIDGDPATFWHTRWQPANDPMPHEMVIDLGKERVLKGIAYLPRQDQGNGRVADFEVYCSSAPDAWGSPQARGTWPSSDRMQRVTFPAPVNARYIKLVARSEAGGNAFAAVAELDVLE